MISLPSGIYKLIASFIYFIATVVTVHVDIPGIP